MIELCCPTATYNQYKDGTLSFTKAKQQLNRYTSTLHGINSAIIKLGKLTEASKGAVAGFGTYAGHNQGISLPPRC